MRRWTRSGASALLAALLTLAPGHAAACADPQRAAAALARFAARGAAPDLQAGYAGAAARIRYRYDGPRGCVNGRAGGFPCANTVLLGHLDLDTLGGGTGTDSWGWHDADNGRYYALVGRTNGTAFVDVTDPVAPRLLGDLPTRTVASGWRDIKTYRHYALIVADELVGHGMQVFDLRRLRAIGPGEPPQTFRADAVYDGIDDAHNIVVNEDAGYAYAVGGRACGGGPHMIDLGAPLAPAFVGCYAADGYTHDMQCVLYRGPDPDYRGREVCFASNEDTLTLLDLSDKTAPVQIARVGYPDAGYTHQGWLDDTQRYFLLDDEVDEQALGGNTRTLVWDLRDLDAPRLAGVHHGSGRSTDHNQYVIGGYVYQANYTRGLRVLKIEDLARAALREVAYFDTHPETDNYASDGAWNVYPFFDSGVLVVSDINRGLFLLRARLDPLFRDGFEQQKTASAAPRAAPSPFAVTLPVCAPRG